MDLAVRNRAKDTGICYRLDHSYDVSSWTIAFVKTLGMAPAESISATCLSALTKIKILFKIDTIADPNSSLGSELSPMKLHHTTIRVWQIKPGSPVESESVRGIVAHIISLLQDLDVLQRGCSRGLTPCFIGPSAENVRPAFVVSCRDKQYRKSTITHIKNDPQFREFIKQSPMFVLVASESAPRLIAPIVNVSEIIYVSPEFEYSQAIGCRLSFSGTENDRNWQRVATAGITLQIHDQIFTMSVSHPLKPSTTEELSDMSPSDLEDDDIEIHTYEDLFDDPCTVSMNLSENLISQNSPSTIHGITSASKTADVVSPKEDLTTSEFQNRRRTDHLSAYQITYQASTKHARQNDWILFRRNASLKEYDRYTNDILRGINDVDSSSLRCQITSTAQLPDKVIDVFVVNSTSRACKAHLYEGVSYFCLPGDSTFLRILTLRVLRDEPDLALGDCGSAVVDANGLWYGHLIASDGYGRFGYLIPATDLLTDIAGNIGIDVNNLRIYNASTSMKAPQSQHHGLHDVQMVADSSLLEPISSKADHAKTIQHVPLDGLPKFIGRAHEFGDIKEKLFGSDGARTIAIYGPGGVGKTRLALEVAQHAAYLDPPCSVLWVQASTVESLEKDFLDIGETLQIPGIKHRNANRRALVKQRLSSNSAGRWLMIVDGVNDGLLVDGHQQQGSEHALLGNYIPTSPLGSVLITTRTLQIGISLPTNQILRLGQMNLSDAVGMFENLANRPGRFEYNAASKLAAKLSYLPLALVQAGAYINMNDISINDYLSLLSDATEERIISLLSGDFKYFEASRWYVDAQKAIVSTWQLSFRRLERSHPEAAKCLSYMSCLHEKDIPQALLPRVMSAAMRKITDVLTGYSFVQVQTKDHPYAPLYNIHRLVRLVTRNWLLQRDSLLYWTNRATQRVAEQFPQGDYEEDQVRWTLYMPHALSLLTANHVLVVAERYILMRNVGLCSLSDGRFDRAISYLRAVSKWQTTMSGNSSEISLDAYYNLGNAFRVCGDFKAAEKWINLALRGQLVLLGTEHPSTMASAHSLAQVYGGQGRWTEAEEMQRVVLEINQRVLGAEHADTLASIAQAALAKSQQRWQDKPASTTGHQTTSGFRKRLKTDDASV